MVCMCEEEGCVRVTFGSGLVWGLGFGVWYSVGG